MQIRFLLGPAGSGKTFRCLTEISGALRAAPEGPPLLLLAPKQATFQLERQLLSDDSLHGYTRLHILSFERLAHFLLRRLQRPPPPFLTEEGRVMVLRGLLIRKRDSLKLFRASARLTGFARQLSDALRELQRHQLPPEALKHLAAQVDETGGLPLKLHDLATLLQSYLAWLEERGLQDADSLLDFARLALLAGTRSPPPAVAADVPPSAGRAEQLGLFDRPPPRPAAGFGIESLWLDGFAELSPQELSLLAALIPHCRRSTLAFCLDAAAPGAASRLSHWSVVRGTFEDCRKQLVSLPGAEVSVEPLPREPLRNRFHASPELARLEESWASPKPLTLHASRSTDHDPHALRLVACANPEAEAVLAAREILRFVRSGGRFREAAVLVRHLEDYQEPLPRVFARYEIPFFLDRREPVTHHPLAELTRSALRTAAFQWAHDDWFAALKTGLVPAAEADIDWLENAALARGWKGGAWLEPMTVPDDPVQAERLEGIRARIVPPFQALAVRLAASQNQPTGPQLAEAVREFWSRLSVEQQLQQWELEVGSWELGAGLAQRPASSVQLPAPSVHATVWDQMNAWLDNISLAFPGEALPLREWLPILEAGLANLSVGLIPPALDQVLVGAVDRSRNPDLRCAVVLGLNESVFPATPEEPGILSDADCAELERQGVSLHATLRERAARERYFGYIACTRASQWLTLACSRLDAERRPLNPSPFIAHCRRIFPELPVEEFHGTIGWEDAVHASELAPLLAALPPDSPLPAGGTGIAPAPSGEAGEASVARLNACPALARLWEKLRRLRNPDPAERLAPELARALHGPVLRTSVSRLEEFAACPFRFFVHSGLRADERKIFELDAREQGTFQHDALKLFHEQLAREGKRWRDLAPPEARERMGRIAAALAAGFRDGLLRDSAQSRFTAGILAQSLQDFIEVIVGWMHGQYEFDPVAVELEFGRGPGTPPGEIDLGEGQRLALQGRIDRVDLWRAEGGEALGVVIDYKSGHRWLDALSLQHGVQLQLPAYLNVLRRWTDPRPLGVGRIRPAGVFYVNLRGRSEAVPSRSQALTKLAAARKAAYRHTGRFDVEALPRLDHTGAADQFRYRLKRDGTLSASSTEALPRAEFEQLLDRVEALMADMGRRIYAGEAAVDPYRKGRQTPCEFCDYRSICRIDPWTHRYRTLNKVEEPGAKAEESDTDFIGGEAEEP